MELNDFLLPCSSAVGIHAECRNRNMNTRSNVSTLSRPKHLQNVQNVQNVQHLEFSVCERNQTTGKMFEELRSYSDQSERAAGVTGCRQQSGSRRNTNCFQDTLTSRITISQQDGCCRGQTDWSASCGVSCVRLISRQAQGVASPCGRCSVFITGLSGTESG